MVNTSSSTSTGTSSTVNSSVSDVVSPSMEPDIRDLHPHPIPKSHSVRPFSTSVYLLSAVLLLLATATESLSLPQDGTTSSNFMVAAAEATATACCACPESAADRKKGVLFAVEAAMIPVLVILSGILAGLTLGYMSLDNTQLSVLAKTGTPKQQYYAKRVIPIRKDGHLLLITLLLGNMIVNETLPVIADGVLGGGVQAVVISTVLVVIFSEIIPQSVCSRFGLAIGSAMVWPVQILIWAFFIVSWPVARLLNYLLGPHSGVVYRRAELKELINIHSAIGGHGGDLDQDTITIVGATLDLQTKVVSDAMTPIQRVFQLPITSKLDYETLGRVLKAGHSRIPVYEEITMGDKIKKKIIGVLLTKQLILLDPEDAVPLRDIPMNVLPTVPEDLPLLQILNTFQEGRSHMAIVCRRKPGYNPIIKSSSKSFASGSVEKKVDVESTMEKGEVTGERSILKGLFHGKMSLFGGGSDDQETEEKGSPLKKSWLSGDKTSSRASLNALYLEEDYPIGLITLEDVLEELIGEEIYDESDSIDGLQQPALQHFIPEDAVGRLGGAGPPPAPSALLAAKPIVSKPSGGLMNAVTAVGRLGNMVRVRSAPGKSRNADGGTPTGESPKGSKDVSSSTTPIATPPAHRMSLENSMVAPTTEGNVNVETLALIREQTVSDKSDTDGDAQTVVDTEFQPVGIRLQNRISPLDLIPPPPTTPTQPALADAILLERGRRMLLARGADPSTLPNLRLAAPRSLPTSRSGTPVPMSRDPPGTVGGVGTQARIVVPPPTVGAAIKKGTFKSPALSSASVPLRAASTPVATTPSTLSQAVGSMLGMTSGATAHPTDAAEQGKDA